MKCDTIIIYRAGSSCDPQTVEGWGGHSGCRGGSVYWRLARTLLHKVYDNLTKSFCVFVAFKIQ